MTERPRAISKSSGSVSRPIPLEPCGVPSVRRVLRRAVQRRLTTCTEASRRQRIDEALAHGVAIGPDVVVVQEPGLWSPPPDVVAQANAVANATVEIPRQPPGPARQPAAHAARHRDPRAAPGRARLARGALVRARVDDRSVRADPRAPSCSSLLAGIGTLAIWRGPLSTGKGWAVVAVAIGFGAALRLGDAWLRRLLEAFGGFFNNLFAVFSNRDYSVLMGYQFLAQAGQGVVQGAIFKAIGVRRREGVRHLGRAVGGLPPQGRPRALHPLYVPVAVRRGVHRPVRATAGRVVGRHRERRAGHVDRDPRHPPAGIGLAGGRGRADGRLDPRAAGRSIGRADRARDQVRGAARRAFREGPPAGQRALAGRAAGSRRSSGSASARSWRGRSRLWIGVVFGAAACSWSGPWSRGRCGRSRPGIRTRASARRCVAILRTVAAGIRGGRRPAGGGARTLRRSRCSVTSSGVRPDDASPCYAKNLVQGGDADTLSQILSGVGARSAARSV